MTQQSKFHTGLLTLLSREVRLAYPNPLLIAFYLLVPLFLIYFILDLVEPIFNLNQKLAPDQGELSPTAAQQAVPGFALFFTAFLAGTLAGHITDERERGLWKRFLVTPIWKPSVVLSSVINLYTLGISQILILLGFGSVVFGMSWNGQYVGIILLTLSFVLIPMGFGLLIASAVRSTQVQIVLVWGLFTVSTFLGGAVVPRFLMDDWKQTASYLSPHYWAMEGFQDLMVRNDSILGILPSLLILTIYGAVPLIWGLVRFNKSGYL